MVHCLLKFGDLVLQSAMDLVLQSALIIRNCDSTAFGTHYFHTVVSPKSSSTLFVCHFALFRGNILVAAPSIFNLSYLDRLIFTVKPF